jgi:hypothetical protein
MANPPAAVHDLAFRYGVDLPTPPKLRVPLPGFAVGSCYRMTFSPDGAYLVVPTPNGSFLWDVASGTKLRKLDVPSNPGQFSFSDDGRELLVRAQDQYARLAIPSGDTVARFKAKFRYRLDGAGCLGPGNEHVLQLAYEGRLLVLDATSGKVLLERQLERTGCDGAVHWVAALGQVVITQGSVANARNRNVPCALWRWPWPVRATEPERLPGTWEFLDSRFLPGPGLLLLHHQPDRAKAPDRLVIDIVDVRTMTVLRTVDGGGNNVASPSLAHDQAAWSASLFAGVHVHTPDGLVELPVKCASAEFSPAADLVAVSGRAGFVAPRAQLPVLRAALQQQRDVEDLEMRGYSRMTTLPDRALPPRLVVYGGDAGVLFETEAVDGRKYVPRAGVERVLPEAGTAALVAMLDATIRRAREPATVDAARERRDFLAGKVTPPQGEWTRAVAVSLASDAIDLWPLKRGKDGVFMQHWSPVAAVPPDTTVPALWAAIAKMLAGKKVK